MLRRSNSGILWVAALATVVGLAGQGQAAFITYTFSGTGTGDLGGSGFSNAPFRVTIQGDTTDISLLEPGILDIVNLPATIEIAGLGVAAFSNPVYVFNNQTNRVVGFGDYSFMDFQGDFWGQFSSPLATYGLDTSYGPITTSASTFAIFADTDRGFLSVEQIGPATFQATVVAVPEPSSVALFSLGLVYLARPRRLVGAISARVGLRAVA